MYQEIDNNIKFLRLVTGEDIISEVIESSIDNKITYTLLNPMKVVYVMNTRPGIISISLMEWVFTKICDHQEFSVGPNNILTTSVPTENLISYYNDCIDHFEDRRQDINKKVKFDAPMEQQDHMELFQEQQEEREVPLEELQELIKEALEDKKRTLH